MISSYRFTKKRKNIVLLAWLILLTAFSAEASLTAGYGSKSLQEQITALDLMGARVGIHSKSGTVNFIGSAKHSPLMVPGIIPGASPDFNAKINAGKYGGLFGLRNPEGELEVKALGKNGSGGGRVRYQQMFNGTPVIGGELLVNMDEGGALLSMNGEIGSIPKILSVTPQIDGAQAAYSAIEAVAKWYGVNAADLQVTTPELSVYVAQLLEDGNKLPARLVWKMEVSPVELAPINEFILIDALQGRITLHFNQIDNVKDRYTYSANNTGSLPGTMICSETNGDGCSNGTNTEADFAHLYAGTTYDFFLNNHGRDSYNDAGATLISTVDYDDGFSCPNAFWSGTQMVYCNGLAAADDVVAHELTHAVTDHTSNLFYYYQSGAINESLSDIWGEFVDLTNGSGTDTASERWMMGEDIDPSTGMGVLRNMSDPTVFGDPDKMTSANYYTDIHDNGGVHTNSGVNNKAAYLMTDGGSFNGFTVASLGISKVAKIYYETQTNLLTSGSDFSDLYHALYQACLNLVGTAGIVASDCDQVRAATDAVEMDRQPVNDYNPDAAVCSSTQLPSEIFYDDMESGFTNWTFSAGTGTNNWVGLNSTYGVSYAISGIEALLGEGVGGVSDQMASISVTLPAGQPFLHFYHSYSFEFDQTTNYDGGVLEYSIDNGATWNDAMSFYDSGRNHGGVIGTGSSNPLSGRSGFVGVSNGYVSTRLNLTQLAGQEVQFRWRVGTDMFVEDLGWLVDDVRIYTCSIPPTAVAGTRQVVGRGTIVTLDGRSSTDSDGSIASYAWIQTKGVAVTLNNADTATPSFTAPGEMTSLSFQLTVTDNSGNTGTDTVTVFVSGDNSDGGGGGGCSLSRDGDIDATLVAVFLGSLVMIWRRRRDH